MYYSQWFINDCHQLVCWHCYWIGWLKMFRIIRQKMFRNTPAMHMFWTVSIETHGPWMTILVLCCLALENKVSPGLLLVESSQHLAWSLTFNLLKSDNWFWNPVCQMKGISQFCQFRPKIGCHDNYFWVIEWTVNSYMSTTLPILKIWWRLIQYFLKLPICKLDQYNEK